MKIILTEKDISKGNLVLINPDHLLEQEIDVNELEEYNEKFNDILYNKNANKYLQFVLSEISTGNRIVPVSGYRTLKEQEKIFEDSIIESGEDFTRKYVALPNASEHQTGLAIDLGLNEGEIDFIRPSFPHNGICETFRETAIKFGFIERYKKEKENITKISAEEWHFRFVGYPHSEFIENNNICLEEYIELLKKEKLIYKNYEISYLPYLGKEIELELNAHDSISGNNVDGFILTRKVENELN